MDILNFKMWIITDFNFQFLRPQKIMKLICAGYFKIQYNFEKVTCICPYLGECDSKI